MPPELPIQKLDLTLDVQEAAKALITCKHWNEYKHRTTQLSPHREADDIWARFGLLKDPAVVANDRPFECYWYYPDLTPALLPLVDRVMEHVGGKELGGVLVTRIPAGKAIYPHIDKGWHAAWHSKYIVCVAANQEQRFYYPEDAIELRSKTGDVFWFRNDKTHAVENYSKEDRISLICCIRTDRGALEA